MTRCATGRCGADDCPRCHPERSTWVKGQWICADHYDTEDQYLKAVRAAKEDCDDL
jgi:hypothetical protein